MPKSPFGGDSYSKWCNGVSNTNLLHPCRRDVDGNDTLTIILNLCILIAKQTLIYKTDLLMKIKKIYILAILPL